jgi:hypothetical protein
MHPPALPWDARPAERDARPVRRLFRLFEDFAGYGDFFHLQDLGNEDASTVRFFTPFADLSGAPVPES